MILETNDKRSAPASATSDVPQLLRKQSTPPNDASSEDSQTLTLALPKGRMFEGVVKLLSDAGITLSGAHRGYRPSISLPRTTTKILKPQNIVEMLSLGSRDLGFAGSDWVRELNADVVEILDTRLDPVSIVVAAPIELLKNGELPRRPLRVASELASTASNWITQRDQGDTYIRSFGATEVFPPDDADCIIDIAASGATLEQNGLVIVDRLFSSSTRLYASKAALKDSNKKGRIEDLCMLLRSVLFARERVMLELNVSKEALQDIIAVLPCMRQPTLSPLFGNDGFAVKAAVPKNQLAILIPLLKARGGTDIVVMPASQVVA